MDYCLNKHFVVNLLGTIRRYPALQSQSLFLGIASNLASKSQSVCSFSSTYPITFWEAHDTFYNRKGSVPSSSAPKICPHAVCNLESVTAVAPHPTSQA